jgi:hypothetical protein
VNAEPLLCTDVGFALAEPLGAVVVPVSIAVFREEDRVAPFNQPELLLDCPQPVRADVVLEHVPEAWKGSDEVHRIPS